MKFVCCSACYERLEAEGEQLVKSWVHLCSANVEHGIINMKYEHDILKTLEAMGYIITTDYSEGIRVKVLGFYENVSDGIPFFCIDLENHHKQNGHPEMPTKQ